MKEFIFCLFCLTTVGCGWDETTYRADKPVSREAASKQTGILFPTSATNIYYVFHAGGLQEYQLYIGFAVAPGDESNAVDEILRGENKQMGDRGSYSSISPTNDMSPADRDLLPMPWWKPESITNGYCLRSTKGQPFCIWADLTEHTVYIHGSD